LPFYLADAIIIKRVKEENADFPTLCQIGCHYKGKKKKLIAGDQTAI